MEDFRKGHISDALFASLMEDDANRWTLILYAECMHRFHNTASAIETLTDQLQIMEETYGVRPRITQQEFGHRGLCDSKLETELLKPSRAASLIAARIRWLKANPAPTRPRLSLWFEAARPRQSLRVPQFRYRQAEVRLLDRKRGREVVAKVNRPHFTERTLLAFDIDCTGCGFCAFPMKDREGVACPDCAQRFCNEACINTARARWHLAMCKHVKSLGDVVAVMRELTKDNTAIICSLVFVFMVLCMKLQKRAMDNHTPNNRWRGPAMDNHTPNNRWRGPAIDNHTPNNRWRGPAIDNHTPNNRWRGPAIDNHTPNNIEGKVPAISTNNNDAEHKNICTSSSQQQEALWKAIFTHVPRKSRGEASKCLDRIRMLHRAVPQKPVDVEVRLTGYRAVFQLMGGMLPDPTLLTMREFGRLITQFETNMKLGATDRSCQLMNLMSFASHSCQSNTDVEHVRGGIKVVSWAPRRGIMTISYSACDDPDHDKLLAKHGLVCERQ